MCIIAIKPRGVAFPSEETMRTCFKRNPDGAGFMYQDSVNKCIVGRKGLMTFDSFMTSLTAHNFTDDDFVALHFRIGTSGGKTSQATHPFPCTGDEELFKRERFKASVGIMHNGVLHSGTTTLSDTMIFIRDILSSKVVIGGVLGGDKKTITLVEHYISPSRVFVMSGDSSLMLGKPWVEDDGIWYSNTTYKEYKPVVTSGGWGGRWNGLANGYDDYNGYDAYESPSQRQAKDKKLSKFTSYDADKVDTATRCPKCGCLESTYYSLLKHNVNGSDDYLHVCNNIKCLNVYLEE